MTKLDLKQQWMMYAHVLMNYLFDVYHKYSMFNNYQYVLVACSIKLNYLIFFGIYLRHYQIENIINQ